MATPTARPASAATKSMLRRAVMMCGLGSVAGEGHRVAVVVPGVVRDRHVREADDADDEGADRGGDQRAGAPARPSAARCRRRGGPSHVLRPFALHPRAVGAAAVAGGRSPGSRVAALARLPGACAPVAFRARLAAHSCGGSRGFGPGSAPHSLLLPRGNRRRGQVNGNAARASSFASAIALRAGAAAKTRRCARFAGRLLAERLPQVQGRMSQARRGGRGGVDSARGRSNGRATVTPSGGGNAVRRARGKSAAVPATVGGSPGQRPLGGIPGRRPGAAIREPGDLPSRRDIRPPGGSPGQGEAFVTSPSRSVVPMPVPGRASPLAARDEVTVLVCSSCRRDDDPLAEPRPGSLLAADARRARPRAAA